MKRASIKAKQKFRSGFETKMSLVLKSTGVPFKYEDKSSVLGYVIPETKHKYYPDWIVAGMVLETKGLWDQKDREKVLLVMAQHPEIDLRMVFENPKLPIYKGSKTTYADFCNKKGIKWGTMADVPSWIKSKLRNEQP